MALKEAQRTRNERLAIPARLKPFMPKIHWALHTLVRSLNHEDFEWVNIKKDEQRYMPFFNTFDDETQARIDRLRKILRAPRESRSAIVASALEIYSKRPQLNEPDKGLRKK